MLTYQNNELFIEQYALARIAEQFGTPAYVYSRQQIEKNWLAFASGLKSHPHKICFAVKANFNLAVLNILQRLGSGFDIVSGGELARVIAAGGDPHQVIFSGVGKSAEEIQQALIAGIYCFNVESVPELTRINAIARTLNKKAPIALRINPDIDAGTHPYIATGLKENKFGIAIEDALTVYQLASTLSYIEIIGIACHLGSQLVSTHPFLTAMQNLLEIIDTLRQQNIFIKHIDIGGGLGVRYRDEAALSIADFCQAILTPLKNRDLLLILEPGRAIIADAGVLLTKVEYLKHTASKNFAIVDVAMNDLLRPALYNAWHNIIPVMQSAGATQLYDVVGPVCETGDFLGKDRPLALKEQDLLAILSTGAYGFVLSSNYNSRGRAAEVMVDGENAYLIRPREEITALFLQEKLLP